MQMQRLFSALWVVVAMLHVVACSSGSTKAQVTVFLRQGAPSSNVSKVEVTSNASDQEAVTATLSGTASPWTGSLSGLSAGSGRTFTAVALDSSGAKLYTGHVESVALVDGEDTLVFITLDDLTASTSAQSEAPILTSLSASPSEVPAGGIVTLRAAARDRNPGDSVRLEWTAPSGTFSAGAGSDVLWTAPSSGSSVSLECKATDSQGLSSAFTVPITVRSTTTTSGSTGGLCCKHCGSGSKPCGDSCINSSYNCTKPAGCACY